MQEEWRDIRGYEGLYQVSNLGRVKSLKDRYGNYREKILTPGNNRGYLQVNLYKDGKRKTYRVHKLVAEVFIDNSNDYKEINHKDEDKTNNRVENLEWCDRKYNANYGTINKRISEKQRGKIISEKTKKKMSKNHADFSGSKHPESRKVLCITTGKKFDCIKEAGEYYSINKSNISRCCRDKVKSAGKHPITGEKLVWKYID